jgi:hypothetical protein
VPEFSLWEALKTIGSMAGLITASFFVYDRLVRARPLAFITRAPLGGAGRPALYLRVMNRSERPLLLTFPPRVKQSTLTVLADHSYRSIVRALGGEKSVVVLQGGEQSDFPLNRSETFEQMPAKTPLSVEMIWSFAERTRWPLRRRIKIHTSKQQIDELLAEPLRMADDT